MDDVNLIKISKPTKLTNISIIRLLATISIVACHFMQYYGLKLAWNFNIGVQIFLIISGFLYGSKHTECSIKKSFSCCAKIYLDYSIFCILAIILFSIFKPQVLTLKNIICQFTLTSNLPGLEHLWFIREIIFCYLLMPFLSFLCDKIKTLNSLKKFFIFLLYVAIFIAFTWLNFKSIISIYFICFVISFMFSACFKNINKKSFIILYILLITTCILLHIIKYYFSTTYNQIAYNILPIVDFNSIVRIIVSFGTFISLYTILKPLNNNSIINNNKFLNLSDKYSYDLYLTHQIFILGPLSLLNLINNKLLAIIISILAFTILTFILILIKKLLKKSYHKKMSI